MTLAIPLQVSSLVLSHLVSCHLLKPYHFPGDRTGGWEVDMGPRVTGQLRQWPWLGLLSSHLLPASLAQEQWNELVSVPPIVMREFISENYRASISLLL